MKKKVCSIVLLCLIKLNSFAQFQLSKEELDFQFNSRVKQLNEFFNRFNYLDKINYANKPNSRISNLVYLFNLDDRELISSQDAKDFVNFLAQDTTSNQLHITDSNWYALVNVEFNYNSKRVPFLFILKPDVDSKGGIAWEIINVKSQIFENLIQSNENYINPQSHEIHFIDLSKLMMNKELNKVNLSNTYKQNNLSIFSFLLKNKMIEFIQTNEISYHFYQIDGWFFTVNDFKRDKNSGWLISNVKKTNTLNIQNIIKSNYF